MYMYVANLWCTQVLLTKLLINNYLLTRSEVFTGKPQSLTVTYWLSDSLINYLHLQWFPCNLLHIHTIMIILFMIYMVHACLHVLVVSFCKTTADYGNRKAGIFVMSTEDYLTNFYPTIQTALDLYYSLAAVNADVNELGMLNFILDKLMGSC